MANIPVALQMYTVRDDSASDYAGTLKRVAALGYAGVELAGTGGMPAADLKALLSDLGLRIAGSHVGIEQLENDLGAALAYNADLGNPYVVCPYMPEERRKDAAGWKSVAGVLNKAGKACSELGMQLCYHNHSFEFQRFDGVPGLDIFFGAVDPDLVKVELDTYWVRHGGEDPAAYIRRFAGRIPLVHLKDVAADEARSFAEVGEGTMDFQAIFAESAKAGVEWYIVEQDVCRRPPLESVAISLANLKKWGMA